MDKDHLSNIFNFLRKMEQQLLTLTRMEKIVGPRNGTALGIGVSTFQQRQLEEILISSTWLIHKELVSYHGLIPKQ